MTAVFVVELPFTAALCYVVLNVATSKSHPDNSFYGLAIGFTLCAAVMGMFAWPTPWVCLLAQLIGGAAAGVTFVVLNPDDK
jgi:aquaporin Z